MALMSYVQRRRSGVYEFRKRLPLALAGKDVPAHMRTRFPDLINITTGKFKHEFVQSLDTKEASAAKKQAHRAALKLARMIEDAEAALSAPRNSSLPATIAPEEIGEAVYRRLLADDEAERLIGDDRRLISLEEYSEERGEVVTVERTTKWPDLEPLHPASGFGMQVDHAKVYMDETEDLAKEYREAYARRDPSIVFPETAIELKTRGAEVDKTSELFQATALEVLKAHVRAYGVIL